MTSFSQIELNFKKSQMTLILILFVNKLVIIIKLNHFFLKRRDLIEKKIEGPI